MTPRFTIDIDHPGFQPEVDPIASQSRIAGLYAHRPPDGESVFAAAAGKLGLGRADPSTRVHRCALDRRMKGGASTSPHQP